jgi:hypothetical protein
MKSSKTKKKNHYDDHDHDHHDDHDGGGFGGGLDLPSWLSPQTASTLKLIYYDFADIYLTATHKQTVHVDANLDATAHNSSNNMFSGSGNPAFPWKVVDNTSAGIELGFGVAYRQGDSVTSSFTDATGATHYNVPDGQQVVDPAHNVTSSNPNRAAWKVDFSVDTALGGSTKTLDQFDFKMLLDIDPTSGVNFKELHLVNSNGATLNGYVWVDANNVPVIGDSAGNPAHPGQLDQNSMNLDFGFWGGAGAPNAAGSHFDVFLIAEDENTHQPLAVNHIVLDVI